MGTAHKAFVALLWVTFAGSLPAQPFQFTVDDSRDLIDENLADGQCRTVEQTCTLRAAIQQGNSLEGPGFIQAPAGMYTLTRPGFDDAGARGDLDILADVTIRGDGPRRTIIRNAAGDRIFQIHAGANVTIAGVTIHEGSIDASGGGIDNAGALRIVSSAINGNSAVGDGGGIQNSGSLILLASTVSGNTAMNSGGGIANSNQLLIVNSTIGENTVPRFGAEKGGGIRNVGANAVLRAFNTTMNHNSAMQGGAIANESGGVVHLRMTILANSISLTNCLGLISSLGHNLDSGNSCGLTSAGDLGNTDPQLGPLTSNGGATNTYALLPSSPARDAGINAGCPLADQRGVLRPQDGNGDGDWYATSGLTKRKVQVPANAHMARRC